MSSNDLTEKEFVEIGRNLYNRYKKFNLPYYQYLHMSEKPENFVWPEKKEIPAKKFIPRHRNDDNPRVLNGKVIDEQVHYRNMTGSWLWEVEWENGEISLESFYDMAINGSDHYRLYSWDGHRLEHVEYSEERGCDIVTSTPWAKKRTRQSLLERGYEFDEDGNITKYGKN